MYNVYFGLFFICACSIKLEGAVCAEVASVFQPCPSRSLERQARDDGGKKGGNKWNKQVEAIIFNEFFWHLHTLFWEKGQSWPRVEENLGLGVDFLQIKLLHGVFELCILVICLVH